jgi:hypothetical protein
LVTVSINSYSVVGGLIGYNSGSSVTNCSVNGNISAESWRCGGLIAHNINSIVTDCYSAVVIAGTSYVGGLIGHNENSTVEFCYSSGSVSEGSQAVGGLVGMNHSGSQINYCYSTVDVTALGSQNAGGLVGGNWQNAHVSNSYAKGFVFTNSTYSGGFIGGNSAGCTVTNCFSIGEMTTLSASMGFLGQGRGTDSGCYWNTETSGHLLSGGTAAARTTAEMTSPYDENTYVDWDFAEIWAEDIDYSINNGYPYLQGITYLETEISEPVAGDILINEICGVDVYPENDFNGYIELLNVRPYSISLENVEIWYFDNGSSEPTNTLNLSGVVQANEYLVIAQDDACFMETHGDPPPDFVVERNVFGNSKFPLDGENDIIQVVLSESRAVTIDRFNDSTTPWTWNSDQAYCRVSNGDGGIFTNWGAGDGIPGENVDTELSIPENVQILLAEGNVNLSWQSVMGGTSYKIYSADNPQALFPDNWILEDSGIESTTWTDILLDETCKFYRIVAVKQRGK